MDAKFWDQRNADFLQIGGAGIVPVGDQINSHVDTAAGETFEIVNTGDYIVVEVEVGNHRVRSGKLAPKTFVDGDVSVADNTIAFAAHGYAQGDGPLRLSTDGVLPTITGGSLDRDFWIAVITDGIIGLCDSRADALRQTVRTQSGVDPFEPLLVDITSAATGDNHVLGGNNGAAPAAVGFAPAKVVAATIADGSGGKLMVPGEIQCFSSRVITMRSYVIGDTVNFWVV